MHRTLTYILLIVMTLITNMSVHASYISTANTLTVENFQDHDTSSDKGFNLNTGASTTTVGANYSGHDKRQTTKATIGNGNVQVGGNALADTDIDVNRDTNNAQEITKDHELGGLDATVTVDHRLASEEGRKSIQKDFVDTTQHAKEIGQAVDDIASTDIGLVDGIKNVDKYAKDRIVLADKAMNKDAQAALKGEEGAKNSETELQALSDELTQQEGLAENTDVNLYDGSQTPDDTPVESANDFNKQEALAGYHENGEDGGNDIYLNIDKTDMTNSSDVVKSLVHEQERHSQAQNKTTLSDTDQTTLATNRGEQAKSSWNAYSDLAGISTKSTTTTQKNWNNQNRGADNVKTATEQMKGVNSEEVEPALPLLLRGAAVAKNGDSAATAAAGSVGTIAAKVAEEENINSQTVTTAVVEEFADATLDVMASLGIIEKPNKTETPIVEITPEDVNPGGSEISEQGSDAYTTPAYEDPVDSKTENIPEGVVNNSTELPVQDDLDIGLMLSEGNRPENLSPEGSGRNGAFNEAKRRSGIPTSQQPISVEPNRDRRGNIQPGKVYVYEVPAEGGGTKKITIRDDSDGHDFGEGDSQNRGPHFNDENKGHYDY